MAGLTTSTSGGSPLIDLKQKALDLRLSRLKSEREFVGLRGKEISPEEAIEIENKRSAILSQLELEGVEIEKEYVELLRRSFGGLGIEVGGLINGCWLCKDCVTSTCLTCTVCKDCVISVSI